MSESRTGILMAGAAKRAITPPVDCLKVLAGGPMGGATEWKGFGAGGSAAADPWETEKAFYTGFRDLAAEIEK